MAIGREPDAKVLFRVEDPHPDSDEAHVETLWAYSLGDDLFELDNMPWFAYGVSCGDIVRAPYKEDEGNYTFERVERKSGNRTIRVCFDVPAEEGNASDQVIKGLIPLGCQYEGANGSYIAVTIPPEASLEAVAAYLTRQDAQWELADPTDEELYPETSG
jgi:hypothetical protein